MAKVIVHMRPDGSMAITRPYVAVGFLEDKVVSNVLASDIYPDSTDVVVIDDSSLPSNWILRNAWVHSKGVVTHDMPKAKLRFQEIMRVARAPLFVPLDQAYMKADEANDMATKKTIGAQKQLLRDVTILPAIAAAKTADDLLAAWPTALLGDINKV